MAKKSKALQTKPERTSAAPQLPDAYHQLHSLLDSIRTLAAHEDDVCTLIATIKRSGTLDGAAGRDLARLLNVLPTECLKQEVNALRSALQRRAA